MNRLDSIYTKLNVINEEIKLLRSEVVSAYPEGVNPPSDAPDTDGDLTSFAVKIGLAEALPNTWIDTKIMPNGCWAVKSMVAGGRDCIQSEVEPGPADKGNFNTPANDTLVNSNGAAWFEKKKQFYWCFGGHGGWMGNEIYWMDTPTMKMGRLNNPSPIEKNPESKSGWGWRTTDGTPISYHTYNAIVAVEELDSFFTMFGAPWPDGNFPNSDMWKFHIPTKKWTLVYPGSMLPVTYPRGSDAFWVPEHRKIAIGRPNYWRWYDPFTNTVGKVLGSTSTMSNGNSVSTDKGIYCFGSGGSCYYIDHSAIGISRPISVSTITHPRMRNHPRWRDAAYPWNSYLWDTKRKMVISWSSSYNSEYTTERKDVGKQVYALDFANDNIYEFVSTGPFSKSTALGPYTKWQHLKELDCYIGLNNRAVNNGWMVFKPGELTLLT
jgi:hypothetical protein